MQIFIDESGSFSDYSEGSLSVVGALCIPNRSIKKVTEKYLKLRPTLLHGGIEVKGSRLSEGELNRVFDLLRRNEALLEVTAIDIGAHTETGVLAYREALANQFEGRLGRFNQQAQVLVRKTIDQMRRTSPPLFLQTLTTVDVLENVLAHFPLYFAQRAGAELGSFKWIVDAKDRVGPTNWELWWKTFCQGVLAARSHTNPAPSLEGADYSHFRRYQASRDGEDATDLELLFSDFRFSAAPEPGLELADIVTNAVRRAMKGHLCKAGWENIPKLMIHRRDHYISLMLLGDASSEPQNPKYLEVVQGFRAGGRQMVAPRFLALAAKEENTG